MFELRCKDTLLFQKKKRGNIEKQNLISVSDHFKDWEFYQKLETMNTEMTFEEYIEQFKVMLVRRYNWSVTKASEYNSPALDETYKAGLSVRNAYFQIFNVEPDMDCLAGDGLTHNEK